MKLKAVDFLAAFIVAIPFLYWMQFKDSVNDVIPVHWNIHGEPDGWESKEDMPVLLSTFGGIGLILYVVLRFLKKIDPKRTAELTERTGEKVGIGMLMLLSALAVLILWAPANGYETTRGVYLILSIFFAFLGNIMYNVKPNYFIGLRLPWTLESEDNWKHTHRLAGILWFCGGLGCALLSLFLKPSTMAPLFFIVSISLLLVPCGYSFFLFKRSKNQSL